MNVKIAINCDVDKTPTFPLGSFRKNSIRNLPTLYIITYKEKICPSTLFLFEYHIRKAAKAKSKIAEYTCVGYKDTPAGAKAPSGNITPNVPVFSAP